MASFDFPLQFKRQYEGPLDLYTEFDTTLDRNNFLTDARRYAGMLVYDKQDGKTYVLDSTKLQWREVPVSSNNTEIRLTFGELTVDNVKIDGNTISTTTGDLTLSPDGSDVVPGSNGGANLGTPLAEWNNLWITGTANIDSLVADTADINGGSIDGVTIGTNSVATEIIVDQIKLDSNVITTIGANSLRFTTNEGTNSGTILINAGINGDIAITPSGTGEVDISKVNIDSGTIDGVTIGTNSVVTDLRVDNLRINDNNITSTDSNGDINITPNNDGDIVLDGQLWPRSIGSNGQLLGISDNISGQLAWLSIGAGGGGIGDVSFSSGLGLPENDAIVKFDGATGTLIQKSGVKIDDLDNITNIRGLSTNNSSGIVHIGGYLRVDQSITLGDVLNADNLTLKCRVDSNILPKNFDLYDLGDESNRWRTVYTQKLSADNIEVVNDVTIDGDFKIGSTGTFTLPITTANTVFAGPNGTDGSPYFRTLDSNDIPNLAATKISSGTLPIARGGTNSSAALVNGRVMISEGGAIVESSTTYLELLNGISDVFQLNATNTTPFVFLNTISSSPLFYVVLKENSTYQVSYRFLGELINTPGTVLSGNNVFDFIDHDGSYFNSVSLIDLPNTATSNDSILNSIIYMSPKILITKSNPTTVIVGLTGDHEGSFLNLLSAGSYIRFQTIN